MKLFSMTVRWDTSLDQSLPQPLMVKIKTSMNTTAKNQLRTNSEKHEETQQNSFCSASFFSRACCLLFFGLLVFVTPLAKSSPFHYTEGYFRHAALVRNQVFPDMSVKTQSSQISMKCWEKERGREREEWEMGEGRGTSVLRPRKRVNAFDAKAALTGQ